MEVVKGTLSCEGGGRGARSRGTMTEEGRKEKERGQEHTQWGEVGEGAS